MIRVVEVLEATGGGTREHLRHLIESIVNCDFDVRLICSLSRDLTFVDDIERYRRLGVRVHVIPMTRNLNPLLDATACLKIRRMLREEPCDILHLHSSKAGFVGRLAARQLACSIVYSPHCFAFEQSAALPVRYAYRLAERLVSGQTEKLLAVGVEESQVATSSGLFHPERVRVIPNAVDVDRWNAILPAGPKERGARGLQVGFVAELKAQKDPLTLVRAMRILVSEGLPIELWMPARGELLEKTRRAVERYGLGDHIHFVENSSTLEPLLKRIELAVLPSRWEAMPYSLLQTLAAGIPVIGSNIPAIREVLDALDSRLIFRRKDEQHLAERLRFWARQNPGELRAVAAKGRGLMEREYSLANWRSAVRDFYRELYNASLSRENQGGRGVRPCADS